MQAANGHVNVAPGDGNDPDAKITTFGGACVRKDIPNPEILQQTRKVLLASWKFSRDQYSSYIRRWFRFCSQRESDPYSPTVGLILSFLTKLYESGLSYSALNIARSALSSFLVVVKVPAGQLPIVRRFLKGVFNLRPVLPKTNAIWDVSLVLNHLKVFPVVEQLSLKDLTLKTVMLLALLTCQRRQTLHCFSLCNITVTEHLITIKIGDLLKQTRPGFQLHDISIPAYPQDRRLCPCTVLKEYIERTASLRSGDQLFISWVKPHKPVSPDTISRWLKLVLGQAGINVVLYTAHSVRSAATSAAESIMKTAGWSNSSTFGTH